MVRLSAEIKRGFLSALYLQSVAIAAPLSEALNAFLLDSFSAVKTGRLVVSHAGSGKTTTFQIPQIGQQFRQEEVFGLAQELTEVYSDCLVVLANSAARASPPVTPDLTDASVYAAMLADDRLGEVTKTQPDFTTLLFPWR